MSQKKPGFFGVLQSVLAAMFGVQSEAKREQDFANGNPAEYIFLGIIMVILFASINWSLLITQRKLKFTKPKFWRL